MNLATRIAVISLVLFSIPLGVRAQQQAKTSSEESMNHLRVDLLITEYSGEKKIGSLPYTLYVGVGDRDHHEPTAFLRMGVRVPISTGTESNEQIQQFTYENVGTNIDVAATNAGDGLYRLQFTVERSAIASPDEGAKAGEQIHMGNQPVMRNFNSRFDLSLRDGESAEGMSATDPFNGHVMKVNVTIHIVK